MNFHQIITYIITDEENFHRLETIGLRHNGKCNNSTIKNIIKRKFHADNKNITIDITKNELISEEEALRRYGNRLFDANIKRRFG